MPSGEQRKDTWLLWTAGGMAAPAYITTAFFVVVAVVHGIVGIVHFYRGGGWVVLMSDGSVLASFIMVRRLDGRQLDWRTWAVYAAAIAILGVTLWLPGGGRGALLTGSPLAALTAAKLLHNSPPLHRRRHRRALAAQMQ